MKFSPTSVKQQICDRYVGVILGPSDVQLMLLQVGVGSQPLTLTLRAHKKSPWEFLPPPTSENSRLSRLNMTQSTFCLSCLSTIGGQNLFQNHRVAATQNHTHLIKFWLPGRIWNIPKASGDCQQLGGDPNPSWCPWIFDTKSGAVGGKMRKVPAVPPSRKPNWWVLRRESLQNALIMQVYELWL